MPEVEKAGRGQEEEEEGGVKMNEEKEADEAHEDDGDYEAEPSVAMRGVKGKRKVRKGRETKESQGYASPSGRCHTDDRDSPPGERRIG